MPTHNELELLHPDLQRVYTAAKADYLAGHPGGLRPRLGETYRPANVQLAYHAQGRKPLAEINQLRHIAGLPPIGTVEAGRVITNALPGQSAHGFNPARAFDVQMVKPNGEVDWSDAPYTAFAVYVKAAANRLGVTVSQGAYWSKFPDFPHTELAAWRVMK